MTNKNSREKLKKMLNILRESVLLKNLPFSKLVEVQNKNKISFILDSSMLAITFFIVIHINTFTKAFLETHIIFLFYFSVTF